MDLHPNDLRGLPNISTTSHSKDEYNRHPTHSTLDYPEGFPTPHLHLEKTSVVSRSSSKYIGVNFVKILVLCTFTGKSTKKYIVCTLGFCTVIKFDYSHKRFSVLFTLPDQNDTGLRLRTS